MTRNSKMPVAMAAVAAVMTGLLQWLEHDWLRGSAGLMIAATLGVIATGLPERSPSGRWLVYGVLALVFVLLGIRLFGMLTRTA